MQNHRIFRWFVFLPVLAILLVGRTTLGSAQSDESIEFNFDLIVDIPDYLRSPVIQAATQNQELLPASTMLFASTYQVSDDGNWARVVLVPQHVIDSGWETFSVDDMVEILVAKDSTSDTWTAHLYKEKAFNDVVNLVPADFIDFAAMQISVQSVESYSFPWPAGQVWWQNGGWHGTNALDFQSKSTSQRNILSAGPGVVGTICGPDGRGEVWISVSNADGIAGYGHMSYAKFNTSLIGKSISRGQSLGEWLYDSEYSQQAGMCGYGAARHIHFELPTRNLSFYDPSKSRYVTANELGNDTRIGIEYTSDNQLSGDGYRGRLYWDAVNSASTTGDEHYWHYWLNGSYTYHFRIRRTSGNLQLNVLLKNSSGGWISSSKTDTNGNMNFHATTGSGDWYIHLDPQTGTTGSYTIQIVQNPYPTGSTTTDWNFAATQNAYSWTTQSNFMYNSDWNSNGWGLVMDPTNDPFMISHPLNININNYRYVAVRMKITNAPTCSTARLFFNNTNSDSFSEARAVSTTVSYGSFKTFYFDMSTNANWTGTLGRLRLDPINCGAAGTGNLRLTRITLTNIGPVDANFSAAPSTKIVDEAVTFTDTSTGSPTSWAWTFGDGATSTTQNPTHTYTSTGNVTVTLTATNALGSVDTITKTITIDPPPPPPAAPTNLVATALPGDLADLSWTDNSTTETSFIIEHSTTGVSDWTSVKTVSANTTSTQLSGVVPGMHFYRVIAVDSRDQRSDPSNVAQLGTPDLVGTTCQATPDHVLSGQTELTITVTNQGYADAGEYTVTVVLSDDAVIGNADDQIITTVDFGALAAQTSDTQVVLLQLPVSVLNSRAQQNDPPDAGQSYQSTSVDYIGVIIDSANAVPEGDETNNVNQGQSYDRDDITYFPWDVTGDGVVNPLDAIFVINRMGQTVPPTDARADFDGSGTVNALDAIAVINRLGYLRNNAVIE